MGDGWLLNGHSSLTESDRYGCGRSAVSMVMQSSTVAPNVGKPPIDGGYGQVGGHHRPVFAVAPMRWYIGNAEHMHLASTFVSVGVTHESG